MVAEREAITIELDPTGKFDRAIKAALDKVSDLRPVWAAIIPQWFKSNRAPFTLKGPGKYADLSKKYKIQKKPRWGFVYPILKASGRLEKSLTVLGGESIIAQDKTSLLLGTATPYAVWLHFGTRKMPARPVIMIGAEQTGETNARLDGFTKILRDYALSASSPIGEVH